MTHWLARSVRNAVGDPPPECAAGAKSRAAKPRSNKRKLVSESEDEFGGEDAAAADSDSEVSGSEFGPAEAGASSDSDDVRLPSSKHRNRPDLGTAPLHALYQCTQCINCYLHCFRHRQSMADFLDDDDDDFASGGKKPSQQKGGKPAAKRKVRCNKSGEHGCFGCAMVPTSSVYSSAVLRATMAHNQT